MRKILVCSMILALGQTAFGGPVFRAGDRVAWIGDSITKGAHHLPHGYIRAIERAARETGTPGFDNIVGLGFSGWHVYSWRDYERRSLKNPALPLLCECPRARTMGAVFTNRLDVIVIALGINDHGFPTFADNDLARWEAEYDRFISDLLARCHPRQLVLCTTTSHTADPEAAANRRLARMNGLIAALARKHGALLVDFWTPAWRAIDRVRTMKTGLRDLRDCVHPNEIGHIEMALSFSEAVGEPKMAAWLDGERARRYAALESTLGDRPRLVCGLRPDRNANRPGTAELAYDIPWNLVGADAATAVAAAVPPGWRVRETRLSPSNGLFRVSGTPSRLVNRVRVTVRLPQRELDETVPIPAPWLVSSDFPFPAAWKGSSWQTNAPPPVALKDVAAWTLHTPTWDYAGDVDPGAIDLRAVNTGYPQGAAYLRRQLKLARAKKLRLVVGTNFWSSHNGLKIWCDGREIASILLESGFVRGKRYSCPDTSFPLDLAAGCHDLVILTANRAFDHFFHCRLLEATSDRIPDDLQVVCPD